MAAHQGSHRTPRSPGFMKPTALVVDASPGYRQSLVARLESLGLNVTQVAAAEELLPHRGKQWRLVVSDWAIPGMMGCELVEALKPDHQPVFINADAETAELSQAAWGLGVRGIFHKSRRLDLMKALRDELAGRLYRHLREEKFLTC